MKNIPDPEAYQRIGLVMLCIVLGPIFNFPFDSTVAEVLDPNDRADL
jgi:hypothetical protein